MPILGSFAPIELLSHDPHPGWKVIRYPWTDVSPQVIGVMKPGFLVKFSSDKTHVLPALAADDANLIGIIVDLPDPQDDPTMPTVAVALMGSFNANRIHYADAWSNLNALPPTTPTALSAAAITQLRANNIYLDPTVGMPALGSIPGVPAITSSLTASATHATAFSYTITASNGVDEFFATNLPAGLTLSGNVISGTAPAAGTYTITLSAANGEGTGATSSLVLTVS
jgi:hypothetical protein